MNALRTIAACTCVHPRVSAEPETMSFEEGDVTAI